MYTPLLWNIIVAFSIYSVPISAHALAHTYTALIYLQSFVTNLFVCIDQVKTTRSNSGDWIRPAEKSKHTGGSQEEQAGTPPAC